MGVGSFLKTVGGGIVDGVKWLKPGGQAHLRESKSGYWGPEKEDWQEERDWNPERESSLKKTGLWIVDAGIGVVLVLEALDGLWVPTRGDEFTDGRHKWDHIDALLDDAVAQDVGWSGDAADNYNKQIAVLQAQLSELHDLDGQMQTLISDHADTVRQMHDVLDGLLIGLYIARIAATAARFAGPEGKAISVAIQIAAVIAAVPTAVGMASRTGAQASETAGLVDDCTEAYTGVTSQLKTLVSKVDNWAPSPVSSQVSAMNSVDNTLNSASFEDGDYPSVRDVSGDSTDGGYELADTGSDTPGAQINVDIGHQRGSGAGPGAGADWNTTGAAGGLPTTPSAHRGQPERNIASSPRPLGSALTTDRRNGDPDDSDDNDVQPRFARPRLAELIALSAEATHMSQYFSDFADSMSQFEGQIEQSVDKLVSATQNNQPPPPAPVTDATSAGEAGQRAPIDGSATASAPQHDLGAAPQVL